MDEMTGPKHESSETRTPATTPESPPPEVPAPITRPRIRHDPLTKFWSVWLPRWLDPWAPRLADASADGAWTAVIPGLAAVLPLVAFYVGWSAARFWPELAIARSFTESPGFMAAVIVAGILSGPAGLMILLGFILQDFVTPHGLLRRPLFGPLEAFLRNHGAQLIGYLLLSVPAIYIHPVARQLAGQTWRILNLRSWVAGFAALIGLYAATAGVLNYLWATATVVLIRPLFTWWDMSIPLKAIAPVQQGWIWLVAAAVVAVLARVLFEGLAGASRRAPVVEDLEAQRLESSGSGPTKTVSIMGIVLNAAVLTLVLAGTYQRWLDAVLVLGITLILGVWREGLWGHVPMWWAGAVGRVPALLRFAIIVIAGYGLAFFLLGGRAPRSFFPILAGALGALVLSALLFPASREPQPTQVETEGT